ncbi:FAD/NAD(P)-binding protein [Frateuria aurantia]
MSDVAIIGNGAAAAAVFCCLTEQLPCSTIHWLGHDASAGRGVAYASEGISGLLNVRAAGMRLTPGQPSGFMADLERHHPGTPGAAFVARSWFGDYVEREVARCRQQAAATGQSIKLYPGRAQSIKAAEDGGYDLDHGNGKKLHVDTVILANGAFQPRPLSCVSEAALTSGRYIVTPLHPAAISQPPRRIIVVGTGLTAIDVLVDAARRWPEAELLAISRHGRLPGSHQLEAGAANHGQAMLNAQLLADPRPGKVLKAIRNAIAHQPEDWRAIIDGMRPVNSALWQAWTPTQRRLFLRHLSSHWDRARHRIPPASAAQIEALQASGRLRLVAARVLSVDGQGPLQLQLRQRGSTETTHEHADLIIQACGLDTRVETCSDPLLQRMASDNLATPCPHGLGIEATPQGQLLDAQRRPLPGLYAIGSLLRGVLWECTAMPEISSAAHALAQTLASRAIKGTAQAV